MIDCLNQHVIDNSTKPIEPSPTEVSHNATQDNGPPTDDSEDTPRDTPDNTNANSSGATVSTVAQNGATQKHANLPAQFLQQLTTYFQQVA